MVRSGDWECEVRRLQTLGWNWGVGSCGVEGRGECGRVECWVLGVPAYSEWGRHRRDTDRENPRRRKVT